MKDIVFAGKRYNVPNWPSHLIVIYLRQFKFHWLMIMVITSVNFTIRCAPNGFYLGGGYTHLPEGTHFPLFPPPPPPPAEGPGRKDPSMKQKMFWQCVSWFKWRHNVILRRGIMTLYLCTEMVTISSRRPTNLSIWETKRRPHPAPIMPLLTLQSPPQWGPQKDPAGRTSQEGGPAPHPPPHTQLGLV